MDPATKQYNAKTFVWSSTELTPKELAENYQHFMPFVIITTTGYMGQEEAVDDVPSDELFWVRRIIRLPRVIVVSERNDYFSIPVTFKAPVVPLTNGSKVGKMTTLKKLVDDGQHRSFMFLDNCEQHIIGCEKGIRNEKLNIIDIYNDSYLLVHPLGSEGVYKEATIIPVYMPITAVIAIGLNSDSVENFFRMMLEIRNFVAKLPHEKRVPSYITDCKDIVMFYGKPKKDTYGTSELYSQVLGDMQHIEKQQKSVHNIYTTMNSVKLLKNSVKKTHVPNLASRGCKVIHMKPNKVLPLLQQVFQTGSITSPVIDQVMKATEGEQTYTSLIKVAAARDNEGRQTDLSAPDSEKLTQACTKSAFVQLSDVPTDLSRLSCEEVTRCLELLNLSQHVASFKGQHIDGCLLADLDADMLRTDFGFSRFEALKLVKFVNGWRPKAQAAGAVEIML